jgi:hypothetical protein
VYVYPARLPLSTWDISELNCSRSLFESPRQ